MEFTSIFILLIGLFVGFILGWLFQKNKSSNTAFGDNSNEEFAKKMNELTKENGSLEGRLEKATEVFIEQKEKLEDVEGKKEILVAEISHWKTSNENLEEKLKKEKDDIKTLQEKFTTDFSLVANKLLKENSSEFAESNQKRLNEILDPLKEKIKSFEEKVEDKYVKEVKERSSLIEQIKSLKDLNVQMSEDAQNLVKALKGDNKAQGNWGELILEKVLESSGLIKGEEYETQHSTTDEERSKRLQPDVIIKLPEEKHIVIDAKVSLVAYESYINTEDQEEQKKFLANHSTSVKAHVKGLSEKNYSSAYGINSPDFVLLFMPIEPSFGLAMRDDNTLYQYAWDKKVIIVTPSTLLATLRTVASVWKQERQTKNAIEIARQAGTLHDKFVSFVDDMLKIKKSLNQSNAAYDTAFNKLKTGNDNLIGKAIKLEELGAKTKKQFPTDSLPDNLLKIEED